MTEQTEPLNSEEADQAWTFRGNQLDSDSFASAMLQLYRGEMGRATTWRTWLDTTTNWVVITVAASLTFVFGSPQNPHFVLLLVLLLVFTFLYIEARRYRYYAIWSYRVRLMETDFFAQMLTPPFRPSPDWANHISKALIQPIFSIAQWEAIGRRFHRTYVWLITLQLISWGVKLIHPSDAGLGHDSRTSLHRIHSRRLDGDGRRDDVRSDGSTGSERKHPRRLAKNSAAAVALAGAAAAADDRPLAAKNSPPGTDGDHHHQQRTGRRITNHARTRTGSDGVESRRNVHRRGARCVAVRHDQSTSAPSGENRTAA